MHAEAPSIRKFENKITIENFLSSTLEPDSKQCQKPNSLDFRKVVSKWNLMCIEKNALAFHSPILEHLGNMFVRSAGNCLFQGDVEAAANERIPMAYPI